jgi:PAS domain S-box-containing protein
MTAFLTRPFAALFAQVRALGRWLSRSFTPVGSSRLELAVAQRTQELRYSEARTRAIVETAGDGIMTLDEEGTILTVNRACTRLFGFATEEMVGHNVSQFMGPLKDNSPGDAPLVGIGGHQIAQMGGEILGRQQDGGTFPASLALSKIRIDGQKVFTAIVHDLRKLKEAEERLRHSEARWRLMFAQVPAVLCTTDRKLKITLFSCSVATGLSSLGLKTNQFVGESLSALDDLVLEFLPSDAFRRALNGESMTVEVNWEDRTIEFHIEPLLDAAHQVAGTIGLGLDITERKRTENAQRYYAEQLREHNAELLRSNQELDEFAYIASHDLKEPLRGIHNYATFLVEDYGDKLDDAGKAKLATLKFLTQRMEGLIDSLLEYSRVGRVDLAVGETDLNEVVREILDSLRITLEEQRVVVRVIGLLPTIRCDRVRVAEVYRNLVSNAIKYNDKPTKVIEIGAAPDPDALAGGKGRPYRLFVRDNGIGIAARHQQAVFRIFKRLHGRDKFGGGTGVGLTIVKKIIERHHGRIWIESQPGEGTTFFFTLEETR